MARWLVKIEGTDTKEFLHWFSEGEIFATEENGETFLVGPAFERKEDQGDVYYLALRTIHEYASIISLLAPGHTKPELAYVVREMDDGQRGPALIDIGQVSMTLRVRVTDPKSSKTRTKDGQDLYRSANSCNNLHDALTLWGEEHTWPRLYRILEEIERHLGKPVSVENFCSNNQRDRFRRSANCAEIAGKDSRHASGKHPRPANPMTLPQAKQFIREMLSKALQKSTHISPPECQRQTKEPSP